MRKLCIAVAAAICLSLALATVAMAANPFIGTWKMDVAKSKASGSAQLSKTLTLKNIAEGKNIRTIFEGVDAQGNASRSESSGTWDGKFFPVTGDPGADTVSIKSVADNTVDVVSKKAGKEAATYKSTVSKDGKVMTIAGKGKNEKGPWQSTMVFEKE